MESSNHQISLGKIKNQYNIYQVLINAQQTKISSIEEFMFRINQCMRKNLVQNLNQIKQFSSQFTQRATSSVYLNFTTQNPRHQQELQNLINGLTHYERLIVEIDHQDQLNKLVEYIDQNSLNHVLERLIICTNFDQFGEQYMQENYQKQIERLRVKDIYFKIKASEHAEQFLRQFDINGLRMTIECSKDVSVKEWIPSYDICVGQLFILYFTDSHVNILGSFKKVQELILFSCMPRHKQQHEEFVRLQVEKLSLLSSSKWNESTLDLPDQYEFSYLPLKKIDTVLTRIKTMYEGFLSLSEHLKELKFDEYDMRLSDLNTLENGLKYFFNQPQTIKILNIPFDDQDYTIEFQEPDVNLTKILHLQAHKISNSSHFYPSKVIGLSSILQNLQELKLDFAQNMNEIKLPENFKFNQLNSLELVLYGRSIYQENFYLRIIKCAKKTLKSLKFQFVSCFIEQILEALGSFMEEINQDNLQKLSLVYDTLQDESKLELDYIQAEQYSITVKILSFDNLAELEINGPFNYLTNLDESKQFFEMILRLPKLRIAKSSISLYYDAICKFLVQRKRMIELHLRKDNLTLQEQQSLIEQSPKHNFHFIPIGK
ncbi:UNKNOWN [Stylonychia lemnae]|uniref:Uncharacterized protein n=1 Tax=Stylonychia lemnae TaxID=5949 RepID=A0A078A6B3_STYLE|nr:UNKNOWN [Stylonychia lemnae]|eukprot:CDW77744.1 UNKNOWN [Stylonychia lemnae]